MGHQGLVGWRMVAAAPARMTRTMRYKLRNAC
jgi:hypothetical protein